MMTPEQAREMAKQADKDVAGQMKTLDGTEKDPKRSLPKETSVHSPKSEETKSSITFDNASVIRALEKENAQLASWGMAISALGGVAGAIYAMKKKKKAWTVVGWFFLGSIIAGIPSGLIIRAKMINKTSEIEALEAA